ncbi:hypothetical protein [Actinoallomurus sp. NPDC050550]|uniref:hypothetical protein n=1 Tax=Actinoallomurus sp. NPDC050550 TaxID=3154937 RepID=UPI0033DA8A3F
MMPVMVAKASVGKALLASMTGGPEPAVTCRLRVRRSDAGGSERAGEGHGGDGHTDA